MISKVLGLLAFAALQASAQEKPEPKLISLNVVAVDNRGQPVDDLTVGDFQITDSETQKIVFFGTKTPGCGKFRSWRPIRCQTAGWEGSASDGHSPLLIMSQGPLKAHY